MKSFISKLLIFIAPLLLLLMPPIWVLISTGESFKTIDNIISKNTKFLIGYAYNDSNYEYLKWKTVTSKPRQKILALGSSRVLSFRSIMFDSSFYNAGFTITNINDFLPFFESVPKNKYPKYLILGLDQWMFNSNWDKHRKRFHKEHWEKSFKKIPNVLTLKYVWQDLLDQKYDVGLKPQNDGIEHIGLNSIVNSIGFRNDGSIFYGQEIEKLITNDSTANDFDFKETFGRIKKGNRKFEFGNEVNPNALLELDKILRFCTANNIKVITFFPPFADKVLSKMKQSGHYSYLDDLPIAVNNITRKNKVEFYNFTSVSNCKSDDSEVIDGFHGSETTYMKLLIKMLESGSVLNQVTNLERLKIDQQKPLNRFEIYGY